MLTREVDLDIWLMVLISTLALCPMKEKLPLRTKLLFMPEPQALIQSFINLQEI
jgi:hypothetical protein